MTHSNTCCPVCRVRLSTWCHHATRNQSLVCRPLWNYIQATYPGEVSARLAGEDKTDPDKIFLCVPNHQFAVEGEIKSEFDAVMERERQEKEEKEREEEERSRELILRLEKDEEEEERRITRGDEELARRLMNTVSPGKENLGVPTLRKMGSINSFLTFSRVRGTKSKPEEDRNSSKVVSSSPLNKENVNFKSGSSRLPTSGSSSGRSKMLSPTNITLFKRENRLSKVSPRCETVVSGALEQYKPNFTHLNLEIVNTPENLEKNGDCIVVNINPGYSLEDSFNKYSLSVDENFSNELEKSQSLRSLSCHDIISQVTDHKPGNIHKYKSALDNQDASLEKSWNSLPKVAVFNLKIQDPGLDRQVFSKIIPGSSQRVELFNSHLLVPSSRYNLETEDETEQVLCCREDNNPLSSADTQTLLNLFDSGI